MLLGLFSISSFFRGEFAMKNAFLWGLGVGLVNILLWWPTGWTPASVSVTYQATVFACIGVGVVMLYKSEDNLPLRWRTLGIATIGGFLPLLAPLFCGA